MLRHRTQRDCGLRYGPCFGASTFSPRHRLDVPSRARLRRHAPRQEALNTFAASSMFFKDLSTDDLVLEEVIQRVRQISVVDEDLVNRDAPGGGIFSVEALLESAQSCSGIK